MRIDVRILERNNSVSRTKKMRSSYKIINKEGIFFITSTIVEWLPVFTSDKYFKILTDSFTFCQKNKSLKIYAYVVLDNHFHMITSCENLTNTIASLKMFTANRIIDQLNEDKNYWLLEQFKHLKLKYKKKSEHQVWQEGFHPQEMLTVKMFEQKVDYIHLNPVRRGLVNEPQDWEYSSAGFYLTGKEGVVKIDTYGI